MDPRGCHSLLQRRLSAISYRLSGRGPAPHRILRLLEPAASRALPPTPPRLAPGSPECSGPRRAAPPSRSCAGRHPAPARRTPTSPAVTLLERLLRQRRHFLPVRRAPTVG